MGTTKRAKIIVDRGLEADLPFGFEIGRMYITTDSHKIFAGQGLSNPLVQLTGNNAGLLFRGAWSNVLNYNPNDLVTFDNSLFIALHASINEQPDLFPADWDLVITGNATDTFFFTQSIPATTWTIDHNLGKHPAVTVEDSTHRQVITEVHFNSNNQVQVFFNAPEIGFASCN